ncbi:MAG: STAS domain-containing protein [Thermoleophilaceae bacterium]|nr:STAS domain-containing protein [Thermoleophilaceae bacterium]
MDTFQWETEKSGDSIRVALIGELDLASTEALESELRDLEETGPSELVLDLRRLKFLDSTGLRVLSGANKRAQEGGHAFRIVKGPEAVQRVFDITGLSDHFELVDEEPV